jgi:anti-anti-sigma factor
VGIALEQSEESSVIHLEGAIDIAVVAEFKKVLLQAFTSGTEVRVVLDCVSDLDVAAMQLLWAARREARALGVEFALVGPAPNSVTCALLHAGFEDFPAIVSAVEVSGVDRCQQ